MNYKRGAGSAARDPVRASPGGPDSRRLLPIVTLVASPEHVDALRALAHRGRLDVFFALVKSREEVAAGELRAELGVPGPTLSHHLDRLRRAGLIEARRQERFIYYRVAPRMVNDLVRLLTACC